MDRRADPVFPVIFMVLVTGATPDIARGNGWSCYGRGFRIPPVRRG